MLISNTQCITYILHTICTQVVVEPTRPGFIVYFWFDIQEHKEWSVFAANIWIRVYVRLLFTSIAHTWLTLHSSRPLSFYHIWTVECCLIGCIFSKQTFKLLVLYVVAKVMLWRVYKNAVAWSKLNTKRQAFSQKLHTSVLA